MTTAGMPEEFAGFSAAGLKFLRDLAKHNERPWFNERKEIFAREIEMPMRSLVFAVAARCDVNKIPLAPNPRQPSFRIYRDVRFSKDKTPYNTFTSAALHHHGDKTLPGSVYLHVDPVEPFMAAGFYMPDKELLGRLRASVVAPRAFAACLTGLARRGREIDRAESLVRLPREYADHAGSANEPYLKLKSFIVRATLDPKSLRGDTLVDDISTFVSDVAPLLNWGWRIASG